MILTYGLFDHIGNFSNSRWKSLSVGSSYRLHGPETDIETFLAGQSYRSKAQFICKSSLITSLGIPWHGDFGWKMFPGQDHSFQEDSGQNISDFSLGLRSNPWTKCAQATNKRKVAVSKPRTTYQLPHFSWLRSSFEKHLTILCMNSMSCIRMKES